MRPFQLIQYAAPAAGTRLIVTGAVHGNETCGTVAIRRVIDDIESGRLTIARGLVSFVPITNPLAYERGQRQGDRNLNRGLVPTAEPREYEDHIANWLCPLLSAHEALLDLHSFHTAGEPFTMVGPQNNDGPLEAFKHAPQEEALALRLGPRRIVDGWLGTYASGVAQRRERAERRGESSADLNADYGVGTTEYMRRVGGWGLTLECGQHDDPSAPDVARRAILNTLAHLRLIDAPPPVQVSRAEGLRLFEVVDKVHEADRFARDWGSFDAVQAGELIGTRRDGTPVVAEADTRIVFPNPAAQAGQEWFYLARPVDRFTA